MLLLFILGKNGNWGRTIRNVIGGGGEIGNFRAAGIFFRYQIPCMDLCFAVA